MSNKIWRRNGNGFSIDISDAQTNIVLNNLNGHTGPVYCVSISPDGKFAVSGSYDKTCKVWDLQSGKELHTLNGHTNYVWCVSISPDGKYAVSGGNDTTCKVWDLQSGTELNTLNGHTGPVYCVSISPDGKFAVSVSYDKTCKVWDLQSGNLIQTFPCSSCFDYSTSKIEIFATNQLWGIRGFNRNFLILDVTLDNAKYRPTSSIVEEIIEHISNNNSAGLRTIFGSMPGQWTDNTLKGKKEINSLFNGEPLFFKCLSEDRIGCIKAFVDFGYNKDSTDKNGDTALHFSVKQNYYSAIFHLCSLQFSLEKKDLQGNTALQIAVEAGSLQIIKLLVENGADCSVRNQMGIVVSEASQIQNVKDYFMMRELGFNALKEKDSRFNWDSHLSTHFGSVRGFRYSNGSNMLHAAIEMDSNSVLIKLIKAFSSLALITDNNGETPLHRACQYNQIKMVKDIVALSTEWKTEVLINKRSNAGRTGLHLAALLGKIFLIRI
jgi:ankyrin repeat protein